MTLLTIALLSSTAFVAGAVDAVAGGGGLIQIPALMLAGIPPHSVLGTNKCAMTLGTSVAAATFWKKGKVYLPIVAIGIGFTLVGSVLGGELVMMLSQATAAKVMIGLLPLGMVAVLMKRGGMPVKTDLSRMDRWIKIPLICLILGVYDGFFGPGTGTFLVLAFYMVCQRDLLESTANAKLFNLTSNIGASGVFLMHGQVIFSLAIPMAVTAMAGNYVGSQLAISKGQGLIRGCLIGVMCLLMMTMIARFVI